MISLGCDVGSLYTKVVCLDEDQLLAWRVIPTTGRVSRDLGALLPELLAEGGVSREQVAYLGATGQGARRVTEADFVEDELVCVAAALAFYTPGVCTALHAGGQSIALVEADEDGALRHYGRNDKCAAGTGRFIEMMAARLGVSLDDVDPMAERATAPKPVTSQCVVFAESEVITLANDGAALPDILAGIAGSVARIVSAQGRRARDATRFTLTGGVARFHAVGEVVQKRLGLEWVPFPENPQLAAALGAALLEEAEDVAPEDEAPEDKAPEDKAPEDEAPEDKAPEDKAPEDKAPEDKAPEEISPERDTPGVGSHPRGRVR